MKRIATMFMALAIAIPSLASEIDSREIYAQLDASLDLTIALGSRCKKELFKYSKRRNECRLFFKMLVVYLPNLEDWGSLSDAQKEQIYAANRITADALNGRIYKTGQYIEWIRAHVKVSP